MGDEAQTNATWVRIRNDSTHAFDTVDVYFPNRPRDPERYDAIPPGQASEYRAVGRAFPIAHVEARSGALSWTIRPFDYVGERALPPGRFTYALSVANENLTLDLNADAPDENDS